MLTSEAARPSVLTSRPEGDVLTSCLKGSVLTGSVLTGKSYQTVTGK